MTEKQMCFSFSPLHPSFALRSSFSVFSLSSCVSSFLSLSPHSLSLPSHSTPHFVPTTFEPHYFPSHPSYLTWENERSEPSGTVGWVSSRDIGGTIETLGVVGVFAGPRSITNIINAPKCASSGSAHFFSRRGQRALSRLMGSVVS